MSSLTLGSDTFAVEPLLQENFSDLQRWITLENHGLWTPGANGLTAEWIEKSPSLFLKQKIDGDFLWRTKLSRVPPNAEFLTRFHASKHAAGADPAMFYNFNFWLRAEAPAGEEFLRDYPKHLGTGWNGMGDDHWKSLFTTIVWWDKGTPDNWVRLRRSPGYEKVEDVQNLIAMLPYDQARWFSFALEGSRVRMYVDETKVYDSPAAAGHTSGYIGFCVWHCIMRYHEMSLYRLPGGELPSRGS
jgi:hypothetical protein